jgi:hypothetical protein
MQIARHILLPAGIAFAVSVPIAINHDEAYLDHRRSDVASIGDFQREHVLGSMSFAALLGASICAGLLKRPNVAAVLGAGAVGVASGMVAGHVAWDQYLARAEGQPTPGHVD